MAARVLLVTTGVLALAGCQSPVANAEAPWLSDDLFEDTVTEYLGEAVAGGASEAQIEVLERALTEGEVTFDSARVAAISTVECYVAAGFHAEYFEHDRASGFSIPGYILEVKRDDDGNDLDAPEQCVLAESHWVNLLYQGQPSAREATGQYVLTREDALRECLEGHGISTDADADGWGLALQALTVLEESELATDCLTPAGVDSL